MSRYDRFDASAALGEVRRVEREVQARSRWQGWLWLTVGIITPAFLIGTIALPGDWEMLAAITFMVAGLLAWLWESRQTVVGRTGARLDRPVTAAFMGTVIVVSALRIFVFKFEPTTANILISLLPAIPCLVGAWLIFRR